MGKKRLRRTKKKETVARPQEKKESIVENKQEKSYGSLLDFYNKNYKRLLIIPFVLLLLAMGQIAYQVSTQGEFIARGVSLKGGTTITIPTKEIFDTDSLLQQVSLPGKDVEIRILRSAGVQNAIVFESDATEKADTDLLIDEIEAATGIDNDSYSVDVIGSSLGESFFKEIIIALIVAFLFMGIVVYLYFRTVIPSTAVILAALSDMIITVAIVNISGMKLSTAGIAAFLMLIGYSIDTDILLSTRLLKRKEGTVFERLIQSAKTGLTMSFSTIAAVTVVLLLTNSEVLTQIMTILLIGLLIDLINTWIQNVGILRWYMEK